VSSYSAWPFLSDPNHPFLSALWAVLVHGLVGIAVIAPIIWRSDHRVRYALLAFVGGSVLDLDHFVVAGSFSLHAIETLSGRPATHSLAFLVVLGLVTVALTRSWLAGWSVFAVNLSHLLFDAAGGGVRVLYPLAHPDGLPWLSFPLGALILLGASTVFAGGRLRSRSEPERDRRDALSTA
jgi:LexA-binding, inner membrane-associated putative hydrolase